MRISPLAVVLSLVAALADGQAAAQQATITIVSSNATRAVLLALAPQIERETHRTPVFRFANSADLRARIEQGEAFDAAVLTSAAIDDLVAQGRLVADSRVHVARAGVGIAVRQGAPLPDVSTPDALRRALVAARSVAYVGQGATAPIVRSIFERFGIAELVKAKTKLVQGAAEAVAEGEAELGFTLISEILPVPGVSLAGPLPTELQVYTSLAAAAATESRAASAAATAMRILTSPEAARIMVAMGLQPSSGGDRLPPIPAAQLTEAQRRAVEDFKAARGVEPSGPFYPLLRSPELMTRARSVGDYVRFKSALRPRLSELAILIVAREWTQQYEWNAHYEIALKAGLGPEVAAAIAEGRRPQTMADDEAAVYDFCTELLRTKSVSDTTYQRALSMFGEQGVIDTVGIVGYYSMLAMVLNTSRTPPGTANVPVLLPIAK
jgi:4-carboxymuconolactone decarboxylase